MRTWRTIRTMAFAVGVWWGAAQCVSAQLAEHPELGKAQEDLTPAEIREKLRNRGNVMTDIKPSRPKFNSSATTPHERGAAFGIETQQPLAHTNEREIHTGTAVYGRRHPLRKLGIPEPPLLDETRRPGVAGSALAGGTGPAISGATNSNIAGSMPQPQGVGPGLPGSPVLRTPTVKERLDLIFRRGPDGKPLAFRSPLPTLPSAPVPRRGTGASGDPTLPFDQTMPSVPGRMPLTRPNRALGAMPSRVAPGTTPNTGVQTPAGAPATPVPTR